MRPEHTLKLRCDDCGHRAAGAEVCDSLGRIKAEKIHRLAKVDWSTVPSAEIEAIFTAALDLENYVPPVENAEDAETALLHEIWSRLSREEAQELFSVCVLDSWPKWVVQRANGHFQTPWERRRDILVEGLEKVVGMMRKPRAPRSARRDVEARPRAIGPIREEVTDYVTPDGTLVKQVIQRGRGIFKEVELDPHLNRALRSVSIERNLKSGWRGGV